MRNLPVPAVDPAVILRNITASKSRKIRSRLVRIRPAVRTAYATYLANSQSLEAIRPAGINGVCMEALLHAYGSATKAMNGLRDTLFFPNIEDFDECPYCGISEPKTLDHYLPKESYPEFSVFPANLIPICHVCNSSYKGTQLLSNTGERLFLHSYFDVLPLFDFICVQVNMGAEIEIEFNITPKADDPYFSTVITNHFLKLGLKQRFARKAAAEIARKRPALTRIFNVKQNYAVVANELAQIASDLRSTCSGNHWKVALYEALSKSVVFCNGGFMRKVRIK